MVEYDPLTDGVKVNIIDGAGSLGTSIDALKTSIDALILVMSP